MPARSGASARSTGEGAVHRADRDARDQAAGPRRQIPRAARSVEAGGIVSWPASAATRRPRSGRRSCSASRWWTIGGRPKRAGRSPPGSANTGCSRPSPAPAAGPARATICTRWTMTAKCCRAARRGNLCDAPAAAARLRADAVAERRGLSQRLSGRFPGLVSHRRCRRDRRGRRRLGDGPHRRHHQRRRPPAVDRRDGGGAGLAPGRRRVRGDRRQGRAEGPDADRPGGAEGRA